MIRVAEAQRRFIHVEDAVCTDVELLPILPPERLSEILARELEGRGFVVEEGVAKRTDDGVVIEVDLETARVSARVERGESVERKASTELRSPSSELGEQKEKEVRDKLRAAIEQELEKDTARLQKEVTAKLEAKLRDLQKEIDEVSNRVAGTALKEKAASLGEILELSEDESGSITIKVKV